jgi:hypothetical protein
MEEESQRPVPRAGQSPVEIDALRAKVSDLEQQASVLIRERPVVAVLAAVGIGYLLARLASRAPR